jgi:hypothetical protein
MGHVYTCAVIYAPTAWLYTCDIWVSNHLERKDEVAREQQYGLSRSSLFSSSTLVALEFVAH